jgi:hypothetical protein
MGPMGPMGPMASLISGNSSQGPAAIGQAASVRPSSRHPTASTASARSRRPSGSRTGLRVTAVRRMHERDRYPADLASWSRPGGRLGHRPGQIVHREAVKRMPDRRPGSVARRVRTGSAGCTARWERDTGDMDPERLRRALVEPAGRSPGSPRGVPGRDAQAAPVTPVGAAARAARRATARMRLWASANQRTTARARPSPRTRNAVRPRLRASALTHSALAARSG